MKPEENKNPVEEKKFSASKQKIAELKKHYPLLVKVSFSVLDDEDKECTHEILFTKPSLLGVKKFSNLVAADDVYEAARFLILDSVVFPAKSEVERLITEYPMLVMQLNAELQPLVQRVKEISVKNV